MPLKAGLFIFLLHLLRLRPLHQSCDILRTKTKCSAGAPGFVQWPLAMLMNAKSSLAGHALVHDRGNKGSPQVSPGAATWTASSQVSGLHVCQRWSVGYPCLSSELGTGQGY